jgi:hypothetical protein
MDDVRAAMKEKMDVAELSLALFSIKTASV